MDARLLELGKVLKIVRYIDPRRHTPTNRSKCTEYLFAISNKKFQRFFRIRRACFFSIVELIGQSSAFQSTTGKLQRVSVGVHLLVVLRFLGSSGSAASLVELSSFFQIGSGTAHNYINRCTQALLELRSSVLSWPDEAERREIASRVETIAVFKNCVGLIDGTLFPLEFKPFLNGCDYFSRKGCYAIAAQVVCDDQARIRDIVVGWPGSTHDNRIWRNSLIYLHHVDRFDRRQYLLGDSAYSCSPILVPSFKKRANSALPRDKEYFNSMLAKVRIKAEHCIGMLKARFQYLKRIRTIVKEKSDMRRIIRFVLAAAILHNLCISDPVPENWIECEETVEMDENMDENIPEETDTVEWDGDGEERRNQVFAYILEGTQY